MNIIKNDNAKNSNAGVINLLHNECYTQRNKAVNICNPDKVKCMIPPAHKYTSNEIQLGSLVC